MSAHKAVSGRDYLQFGAGDSGAHTSGAMGIAAGTPVATAKRVPLLPARATLHVLGLALALATLVAQIILVSHKEKGYYIFETYAGEVPVEVTFTGRNFAKEPFLVIAVAAVAALVDTVFLVFLCYPVVSASLAGAIVEVSLVPIVAALWLAAIGVSAKTASVIKGYGWPEAWKASNRVALGCGCASALVWVGTLVLAIIALVRIVHARRARRRAQGRGPNGADLA